MEPLLSVDNISKEFSGKTVVEQVSFDVYRGEIMGMLGPNGAGKTTVIRSIMGIILPDRGRIRIQLDHPSQAKSRIGYLPEERGLYKTVKVIDILTYLAGLKKVPNEIAQKRISEYLEKFDLKGKEQVKVEELSKGMAQKVQFIASVIHEPDILILDEPFSGLDPVSQDVFKQEITALADRGTAILLSSHQMNLVEALCNRIFLINKGEKVIYGEMDVVKESFADFKCTITGSNDEVDFTRLPMVERVERNERTTLVYLKKEAEPARFLSSLPASVDIRELSVNRISLHDIFVSIAKTENTP